KLLTYPSVILYKLGINSIKWQNPLGTALSYPFQIEQLRKNLRLITSYTDMIVPITQWYYKILLKNGVQANKMKVVPQALPTQPDAVDSIEKKETLPIRLIFIGRIDTLKGVPLLLDVVKQFDPSELTLDLFGPVQEAFYREYKDSTLTHTN